MGPEVASLHGQVAPPISSGTFRARGVQLTFLIQEDDDFGRETFIIFNHFNLYLISLPFSTHAFIKRVHVAHLNIHTKWI
jgi:hypothetical protein